MALADLDIGIKADTAEPEALIKYIQQSVAVTVTSLNQNSIADYQFTAIDGHSVQVNRTQAGELLGDIDSFEDELRRYYHSADETFAIIEGIISPYKLSTIRTTANISLRAMAPPGSLYAYRVSDTGFIVTERAYDISNKMFKAWLLQIDKAGITVYHTINYVDTAAALVAFYTNLQKTEHTTLQRYIKPKIQVRDLNPHVQALINLSQAYKLDIGEVKATAIMEEFGDLFNVMIANGDDLGKVKGIGKKTIDGLFEKIGRDW